MGIKRFTSDDTLVYPRPVLPLTNMVFGTFFLILSMLSIWMYWSFAWKIWDALSESFSHASNFSGIFLLGLLNLPINRRIETSVSIAADAFLLVILMFVVVFTRNLFVIFTLSVSRIVKAILQWMSSGEPEDVPVKYENPLEVAQWIGEQKEYRSKLSSPEAISVFGYGVQYVSPAAADIAQPTVERILRTGKEGLYRSLKLVFVGLVFVGFLITAPNWSVFYSIMPTVSAILRQIGKETISWTVGGSYCLFLFVAASCIFLDWLFVRLLSSRAKPVAEVSSQSENVQVAIAPYLVSERFQQDLERAKSANGKAGRVYRTGTEDASVSIADMGSFVLLGLVEQHPEITSNPNMKVALMRLWSGWVLVSVGAILLTVLLVPSATWNSAAAGRLTEWKVFLDPVLIFMFMLAGNRALREGLAMVAGGEALLETYWFEAPSLKYDFRGVTSKSEIRLGNAHDDSIQTSSYIARSEFVARLTATSLIAEVAKPLANRRVFGMQVTEGCDDLADDVLGSLRNLSGIRPQAIGLDLSHADVADTINANVAARAAKVSAERIALRRSRLQPEGNERLAPPSGPGEVG